MLPAWTRTPFLAPPSIDQFKKARSASSLPHLRALRGFACHIPDSGLTQRGEGSEVLRDLWSVSPSPTDKLALPSVSGLRFHGRSPLPQPDATRVYLATPKVITSNLKNLDSGLGEYPAGSATPAGYLAMPFAGNRNYASAD